MREGTGDRHGETRLPQFAHRLYFDLQTIEGVRPLDIWNGVREFFDPFEKTSLIANLYKIVIPLVNERCFGRPFDMHSRRALETVTAVISWLLEGEGEAIFERFPYPPTGDGDQKELYRAVKSRASLLLADIDADQGKKEPGPSAQTLSQGVFSSGLFDFREMRIVDNELPFIIFTDKEFRVIHGMAIVYLWLIDLDAIFLQTLEENGIEAGIIEEYRSFARRVQKENPLTIQGRSMDPHELLAHIQVRLKSEDYLDLFETVYRWLEQARTKLKG
ncbi:MAG: hypothetical protein ABSG63_10055 [Spirochaetia bacterium]